MGRWSTGSRWAGWEHEENQINVEDEEEKLSLSPLLEKLRRLGHTFEEQRACQNSTKNNHREAGVSGQSLVRQLFRLLSQLFRLLSQLFRLLS